MVASRLKAALVVHPPGPVANWGYRLIQDAAARSGISVRHIDRTDAIPDDAPSTIYLCQFPSRSAIDLISAGRLEPVLVAHDPVWGIAALVEDGNTVLEGIRLLTASMTANIAIGTTSRSRVVFPAFDQSAAVTARSLLAACGLPTDPTSLDAALAAVGVRPETDSNLDAALANFTGRALPPVLSEAQLAVADKVVAGLVAAAQGDLSRPIIWPTDVYFSGDAPNAPVPVVTPVTGPSRVMVYGPYLHLPPARYRVEIIIAFAGRIEEIPFLLEVFGGEVCLARLRLEGRRSGGYRGRFSLTVIDPVAPIEVRLRNERGAIEGEVSLVELRFYSTAGAEANDFS